MKKFDASQAPLFDQRLALREAELCALLAAYERLDGGAEQAEQAGHELEQVLAARRRLQDDQYGHCLDCGQAIAVERLLTMPACAWCPACHALRGRDGQAPLH